MSTTRVVGSVLVVGGLGMMAYGLWGLGKQLVKAGNLAALTIGLKAMLPDVVKTSREKEGDNWKVAARAELRSTWELATADLEHDAGFHQVQNRLHAWIDDNLTRIEMETTTPAESVEVVAETPAADHSENKE